MLIDNFDEAYFVSNICFHLSLVAQIRINSSDCNASLMLSGNAGFVC
jgi:hypothetical protein